MVLLLKRNITLIRKKELKVLVSLQYYDHYKTEKTFLSSMLIYKIVAKMV